MSYFGAAPTGNFISTASQRVTGSTNNYVDLDHAISALSDVIVLVNSVKQDITNLTFTSASRIGLGGTLVSSDVVEIVYLGKSVATQTPGTGTVTSDMLAGSIANSKLANSSITLNGSAVSLGGSANVGYFGSTYFNAKMSGTQSISHNTDTKVDFDTEIADLGNNFNTSSQEYTAPSAGIYLFNVGLHIASNQDGQLKTCSLTLRFTPSGGSASDWIVAYKDNESSRQKRQVFNVSVFRSMAANEVVFVRGYANVSADTPEFYYTSEVHNYFSGYRVY